MSTSAKKSSDITWQLAAYAVGSKYAALPCSVRAEIARAFLNWMGCVLGGCHDPAVEIAAASAAETCGRPQASIIGRGQRADIASAAFLNSFSSSVLSYDDTHLATVTHPTGPVAAALFAFCETRRISGEEFLNALALGMEVECRLSNVLLLPPSQAVVGLYVTGLTGPIGAAVALGRLLGFDEQRMIWAIGLAAAQAAGFRATHGSMTGLMIPALGARNGVSAAILASKGLNCSDDALEGRNGFFEIFAPKADLVRAVAGLGEHFEVLANTYKPYPCGIVIHPAVDACLDVALAMDARAVFDEVTVTVHPLALALADRRKPATPLEAQVSLHHWAAAALARRAAGVAELSQDCIDDPAIARLRERIRTVADPSLRRDEAIAEIRLSDGTSHRSHVAHARGSVQRPMTDGDLDRKFREQASLALPRDSVETLLRLCREVATLQDVGTEISAVWNR